jgi:type I restriction enzyme M protein
MNARSLGQVILKARSELGWTQEQLARELGVVFSTVNRWENGKGEPGGDVLRHLAALLREQRPDAASLAEQVEIAASMVPPVRRRGRRPKEGAVTAGAEGLDTKTMEGMLWKAACSIRGEKDAPKFKDFILPLLFIKRLSDVFEDEVVRLYDQFGDEETVKTVLEVDHTLVRFYIPEEARWPVISGRIQFEWPEGKKPKTLGEMLTNATRAIARANPILQGVITTVDFNETRQGEREISDAALSGVIELLSEPRYRLGLKEVEPDFLGRAYEYLLRKFAEGQGQSAGEFYTPKEVGVLIARLVEPQQGEEAYDYACGSAGLLVKCELRLHEREGTISRPLKLYGQELTGSSYAIARMNVVLHDMEAEIVRGNTMTNPKFLDGAKLKRFDVVVANPMWNQNNFDPATYENDPFERFTSGYAPTSSADWAWLQHTVASLNDHGCAAVVLDTGAVARGSGSQSDSKEKMIRKTFVDNDWIEAVVLLPDNLFYNTPAAGIIVVLNRAKRPERQGKVILINATADFEKGRPKNFLPDAAIAKIADAFHAGADVERFVKVVPRHEIEKNDYNLSPSRYIETAGALEHRPIQTILDELGAIDAEAATLDAALRLTFERLGFIWSGDAGPQQAQPIVEDER